MWGCGTRCGAGLFKIPDRMARIGFEKIDGKEGFGSGDGHLWQALSRRHGHRFAKFLLHLKAGTAVLRAEPLTQKLQEQHKSAFLFNPATCVPVPPLHLGGAARRLHPTGKYREEESSTVRRN